MWIDKKFFSVRGFKWILWMLVIYFTQMRSICILFLYFCEKEQIRNNDYLELYCFVRSIQNKYVLSY